jgi:hypothetical protein
MKCTIIFKLKVMKVKALTFGMKIVEANLEERTAVLKLTQKQPGKMTVYGEFNVVLSRLLRSNIKAGRIEIGKYYESEDRSPEYHANPFQLIKTGRRDGTGYVYILDMVFRKPDVKVEVSLPNGGSYTEYRRDYHKKADFKRWRNYVPKNYTVQAKEEATA